MVKGNGMKTQISKGGEKVRGGGESKPLENMIIIYIIYGR